MIEFSIAQLGVRRLHTIDSQFSHKVSEGCRIVPELDHSNGYPNSSNLFYIYIYPWKTNTYWVQFGKSNEKGSAKIRRCFQRRLDSYTPAFAVPIDVASCGLDITCTRGIPRHMACFWTDFFQNGSIVGIKSVWFGAPRAEYAHKHRAREHLPGNETQIYTYTKT